MDEVAVTMQALNEIDKQIDQTNDYEKLEAIRRDLVLRVVFIESKQCHVWKVA